MLNGIKLENFKGIIESDIDFNTTTILIGPNGSGKSSIGQALLILCQSLEGFNRRKLLKSKQINSSGKLLDLGNIEDLYFQKNLKTPIVISIKNRFEKLEAIVSFEIKDGVISIEKATINGLEQYNFLDNNGDLISDITINKKSSKVLQNENFKFILRLRDNLTSINVNSILVREASEDIKKNGADIRTIFIKLGDFSYLYENIFYIPALRGTDRSSHTLVDESITYLSPPNLNYDKKSDCWISKLLYDDKLFELISSWCEEILETKLKLEIKPGKKLILSRTMILPKDNDEIKIRLVNEGFGLNQIAFLLTQLAIAHNGSIVIIEEPEIHLHPKAQSKLMEIITKHALNTDKKLLITTHSEHIVYYALTKVGLKEMNQEDLSLYYFQKDNNKCYSRKIIFDENGQLEDGLPGFFDVNIERFRRYQKILMEK